MGVILRLMFSILVSLHLCDAYKILVVYPLPARSHANLGDGIVRNLLKAGHEVTYISPFEYKNAPKNLRLIDVSSNIEFYPVDRINIKSFMNEETAISDYSLIKYVLTLLNTKNIEQESVQKLLNDPKESFDVVLVEWLMSEIPAGFATVFNCPLIWVAPVEVNSEILQLIDQIASPAYLADLTSQAVPPFTFSERVRNLWTRLKMKAAKYLYFNSLDAQEFDRLFAPIVRNRGRQPPQYNEARYNASLILANYHVSMGQAVRLPQNYKPIGGYHIDEEIAPLPEDLKKIMDNAKNGVIYFSMGSNLKSKDWPQEIKSGLLKMFGGLKQTVLWKFEEDFPNVPKNVHILKWAPQLSILTHPNFVLFVSHGGLLSSIEAIHFGVPLIGIPVFGDQFIIVDRNVAKGFALKVDLSNDLVDKLKEAIVEVTNNPKYRQKAKELSLVYHDRPVTPGDELVHWVEHVVKTQGALHLRSPALFTPLYETLYLDLLALIVGIVAVLYLAVKQLFRRKTNKDNIKKNK